MNLSRLLIIHAVITGAAGITLIAAPRLIPQMIGIDLDATAYILCYMLGTAELSLAVLSFAGAFIKDTNSLRIISVTFMIFHALTAAVEILAFAQGLSAAIWINVAVRVSVTVLFWYYGISKTPRPKRLAQN